MRNECTALAVFADRTTRGRNSFCQENWRPPSFQHYPQSHTVTPGRNKLQREKVPRNRKPTETSLPTAEAAVHFSWKLCRRPCQNKQHNGQSVGKPLGLATPFDGQSVDINISRKQQQQQHSPPPPPTTTTTKQKQKASSGPAMAFIHVFFH